MAKQAVARKSTKKQIISNSSSNNRRKRTQSNIQDGAKQSSSSVFVIGIMLVSFACLGVLLYPIFVNKLTNKGLKKEKILHKRKSSSDENGFQKQLKDFQPTIQRTLKMKSIQVYGKELKIQELKHGNKRSSVKAYIIDGFLSDYECDGLATVHQQHVRELESKSGPIMCFASIGTLRKYFKEVGLKMRLTSKDFTAGTTCLNETLSNKIKNYFKWSFSTAFYPGENKFSTLYAEHIEKVSGLKKENGGKFQITSYPQNVGYKNHTDCIVFEDDEGDKRDRYATVLVYLQNVEKGGETIFPQLGIKVKPKKGRALVWNSMTSDGNCDPTSIHNAAKVEQGHKFIIQRWYYYKSFPALGKRAPEPHLPARKPNQPRVTCDEYEQGSCRWYDEWNYEHIVEYAAMQHNLL